MKKQFIAISLLALMLVAVAGATIYAATTPKTVTTSGDTATPVTTNAPIEPTTTAPVADTNKGLGLIAVALSTGLACIGAGIAVAVVASSAVGAISENPKLLGKTIIFAGLAEGIAIYGLIISIMILDKI